MRRGLKYPKNAAYADAPSPAHPGKTITSSASSARFGASLDHLVVFDEAQLRRILKITSYYNQVRTHLSLGKNAPDFRLPDKLGSVAAIPILGGLHDQLCQGLGFD
jgi:hypothetical protein